MRSKSKSKKVGAFEVDLSARTPLNRLLDKRRKRTRKAVSNTVAAGIAAVGAGIVGSAVEYKQAINDPIFRKGVALIAGFGFLAAVPMLVRVTYLQHAPIIKEANHLVAKGLAKEAQKNEKLMGLLKTHRYVIVDRKGDIYGTKRKRFLGIGRIRLESQKILDGSY